jgi:hypothetical protein
MANHSEKCIAEEDAKISETRAQFGLEKTSLGATMLASDTTLVILGFFTTVLSQTVSSVVPETRKLHATILSICLAVLLFMSIRLFVDQTSLVLWRLAREFTITLFRFLKFVSSLTLVVISHFVTDLLFSELGTGMSWVESAAIIVAGVLTVYLVLQLFHISSNI